jgi:hypothetical protein
VIAASSPAFSTAYRQTLRPLSIINVVPLVVLTRTLRAANKGNCILAVTRMGATLSPVELFPESRTRFGRGIMHMEAFGREWNKIVHPDSHEIITEANGDWTVGIAKAVRKTPTENSMALKGSNRKEVTDGTISLVPITHWRSSRPSPHFVEIVGCCTLSRAKSFLQT